MKNLTIAIIDSGLGGLSLFNTFLSKLNVKSYVYLADLKNLPYGSKTREELICITLKNVKRIIDKYSPDAIVFGCNTIGTTIFKYIKNSFPNVVMFAIKPNLSFARVNKKTLVLATPATIDAIKTTEEYVANKSRIVLCKMPRLARKVEDYIQKGVNLVPYLKHKLRKFNDVDSIVLGCTHYYFIKSVVSSIYPDAQIIDGVEILCKQIKSFFKLRQQTNTIIPQIKWELTSNNSALKDYKKIVQNIIKNQNK